MKKTRPFRYVSYLRCSTDDQAFGDYTTIDTQRAYNRELIEKRIQSNGGSYVGEYVDEGRTGTNLRRPGWTQLLADGKARKFDVVVVTYMSRLARGEAYHVAEYLIGEERGKIVMVQEFFTEDLAGQMNKNLKIFMDGMYPKQVSEWTKTAMQRRVENGWHTGGVAPYGFTSQTVPGMSAVVLPGGKTKPAPKQLIPDENEAPHVVRAFEVYAETQNMGNVRKYLRQISPERTWTIDTVRRLLTNERYRGVAHFGKTTNPAAHPAIVEEELWERVQSGLAQKATLRTDPRAVGYNLEERKDDFTYYLRGKVLCSTCGCRMTPASAHGKTVRVHYYQCTKAMKSGSDCPTKRVNANTLHAVVLGEIFRAAQHPTRMDELIRLALKKLPTLDQEQRDLFLTQRNIREADKKISRLVGAIRDGKATALDILTSEIERVRSHQSELKEKEAQLLAQTESKPTRPDTEALCRVWSELGENWRYLTEEEKAEILGSLVDQVTFTQKNEGALRLLLCLPQISERPIEKFVFRTDMGAGVRLELTTFGL